MRQLLPSDGDGTDPFALLGRADRRPVPGRPWVMANMVASLDGAYSVDGRSRGLSNDDDRQLFLALRNSADAVLVGAGTARDEGYRRPNPPAQVRSARAEAGLSPAPRLALVSRSGRLPADLPLLGGPGATPLLFHPSTTDVAAVPEGVQCRAVGADTVDLAAALDALAADGVEMVMCEGGPGLLGQLHQLDLIDELHLTHSPQLVGGARTGLLGAAPASPHRFELTRLMESDGFLFGAYRRSR